MQQTSAFYGIRLHLADIAAGFDSVAISPDGRNISNEVEIIGISKDGIAIKWQGKIWRTDEAPEFGVSHYLRLI